MPSILPSPSNKYLIQADTPLDPPILNSIFESLHDRIAAYEAQIVDYQAAIDNLNNLGLEVLAENLSPQIQAARDQLDAFELQLTAAEDQVAALIANGLAGTGVTLTEIDGLDATNAQAAFAELVGDLDALGTALSDLSTAVSAAIGAIKFHTLRPVIAVTEAHTAVAGQRVYADSTGGAFDVTTPLNPVDGVTFAVYPIGLEVTVVPNGTGTASTIEGLSTMLIDQENTAVEFTFVDGDWKMEFRRVVNG